MTTLPSQRSPPRLSLTAVWVGSVLAVEVVEVAEEPPLGMPYHPQLTGRPGEEVWSRGKYLCVCQKLHLSRQSGPMHSAPDAGVADVAPSGSSHYSAVPGLRLPPLSTPGTTAGSPSSRTAWSPLRHLPQPPQPPVRCCAETMAMPRNLMKDPAYPSLPLIPN